MLFQRIQDREPLVAALVPGRVAPAHVEKHRLVRQPPIAEAPRSRSPNTFAVIFGIECLEPRVHQRRALSGSRWADQDVPREKRECLLTKWRLLQRDDG